MSWTQASCPACWYSSHDREPVRIIDADSEQCSWCGVWTRSGIYTRADPETVYFPRKG